MAAAVAASVSSRSGAVWTIGSVDPIVPFHVSRDPDSTVDLTFVVARNLLAVLSRETHPLL